MANDSENPILAMEEQAVPLEPLGAPESARIAQIEIIISNILRYGVALSFAVVLIGTILLLIQPGAAVRTSGPPNPHDPGLILTQAVHLQPKGVIDLGLMILIATPVFRVGVAIIAFLMEADYIYTVVSLFVFLVLTASFLLGHAGG